MKSYTSEELKEILRLHKDWINGINGGKRAVLIGADLSGTDLSGAALMGTDLSCANLSGANLSDTDLSCANLSGANLSGADLRDANLRDANLSRAVLSGAALMGADLSGTDLRDADLRDADLSGADLSGADLRDADLSGAALMGTDLSCANLSGANLSGTDLSCANLSGTDLRDADLRDARYNESTAFFALQCPEEGDFIGWKKCSNNVIVKLLITGKRSSATSRKCRCSEAKVLEVIGAKEGVSQHDSSFIYRSGETVRVENFNENRWNECSTGIHFFITRAEAENYN